MYFFIGLGYILSFLFILFSAFHFMQYVERSHVREWSRQLGLKIFRQFDNKLYKLLCKYFLQQVLIISEITTGLFEGLIGLEPMVQLIENNLKPNNVNLIDDKLKIKESDSKFIIVRPPEFVFPTINIYADKNEKILDKDKDNEKVLGTAISQIKKDSIFVKIDRKPKPTHESDYADNKFIDSPRDIKKIIKKNNINTNFKKDGNKIKITITKKQ